MKVAVKTERFTWNSDITPINRYVIIGNGFDLECGLPTSYTAFLELINCYRDLSQWFTKLGQNDPVIAAYYSNKHNIIPASYISSLESVLSKYSEIINSTILDKINPLKHISSSFDELIVGGFIEKYLVVDTNWCQEFEFWSMMFDNFWYRYLSKARMGKGWIDFEDEIEKLIEEIEHSMMEEPGRRRYLDSQIIVEHPSNLSQIIEETFSVKPLKENADFYGSRRMFSRYNVTYRDLRDKLIGDLNSLVKRLEVYLRDYVSVVDINISSAIGHIVEAVQSCRNTFVLSFNYTDTLESILNERGVKAEFCYVHGRLSNTDCKNCMVLGFSEKPNGMKDCVEFAAFRKYNQRIFKGTDSAYRDWANQANANGLSVPSELLIFGHSLGVTDGDIIRSFIQAPNTRTVVYYHDEDAFSEELANATAILGVDYIIDKTGGKNRTLRFAEQ